MHRFLFQMKFVLFTFLIFFDFFTLFFFFYSTQLTSTFYNRIDRIHNPDTHLTFSRVISLHVPSQVVLAAHIEFIVTIFTLYCFRRMVLLHMVCSGLAFLFCYRECRFPAICNWALECLVSDQKVMAL